MVSALGYSGDKCAIKNVADTHKLQHLTDVSIILVPTFKNGITSSSP